MSDRASLQSVLQQFLPAVCKHQALSPRQWQICHHLLTCQTEALGGCQLQCDACDYQRPQYHSCRDRHCPRCQRQASAQWCARQQASTLAVPYYHLVFTLPHSLNGWVQLHPAVIYARLFQAVWATLRTFGADRKRLGGEMGMTAVLHTWGQCLDQHVHLHCLVPGGALTASGAWHAAKSDYLFPVRALSNYFRGTMVRLLRQAEQDGHLNRVTEPGEIDTLLNRLMESEWVVYSKACLNRTDRVVHYLARYSHRIALSDGRLVSIEGQQVRLRYKDYRDRGKSKVMTLSGTELIRRFLLHSLPKGLMRIRHYGFLANRCRVSKLARIREDLGRLSTAETEAPPLLSDLNPLTAWMSLVCPKCHRGHLQSVALIAPQPIDGG